MYRVPYVEVLRGNLTRSPTLSRRLESTRIHAGWLWVGQFLQAKCGPSLWSSPSAQRVGTQVSFGEAFGKAEREAKTSKSTRDESGWVGSNGGKILDEGKNRFVDCQANVRADGKPRQFD